MVKPPNYTQLIRQYPGFSYTLDSLKAQQAGYQTDYQAALQRALTQYGQIPEGLSPALLKLIGPTVQGLAQQATQGGVSTLAGLQRDYGGVNANLAARGMLQSGAFGQHLEDFNRNKYQAEQSLLDTISGLQTGFQNQQSDLRNQGVTALQNAYKGVVSGINAGLYPGGVSGVGQPKIPRQIAAPHQASAYKAPSYLTHGGAL